MLEVCILLESRKCGTGEVLSLPVGRDKVRIVRESVGWV